MSINSVNGSISNLNYQTNQISQTNQSSDSKGGVGHKGGHHPHNHKKNVDSVSISQEGLKLALSTASTSDPASNNSVNNAALDIEKALSSQSSNSTGQSLDQDNDGDQK
jgi:hypothetical protein